MLPFRRPAIVTDSRPEAIHASIEGTLRRLRTDYVDLYYQHRIDPKVEPETVAEVRHQLIAEGKVRAWGISETTEDYLRRANAICPVAAVQMRYSMMARWHESLWPVLEELNIAFVAFSPLANGFLTGAYGPVREKPAYHLRVRQPRRGHGARGDRPSVDPPRRRRRPGHRRPFINAGQAPAHASLGTGDVAPFHLRPRLAHARSSQAIPRAVRASGSQKWLPGLSSSVVSTPRSRSSASKPRVASSTPRIMRLGVLCSLLPRER